MNLQFRQDWGEMVCLCLTWSHLGLFKWEPGHPLSRWFTHIAAGSGREPIWLCGLVPLSVDLSPGGLSSLIWAWLFEELLNWFPQLLYHFSFPSVNTWGFPSVYISHTVIFCLFYCSHSSGCEGVSHCSFGLHFCDNWWCWTSLWGLIGYLYIKKSIQTL